MKSNIPDAFPENMGGPNDGAPVIHEHHMEGGPPPELLKLIEKENQFKEMSIHANTLLIQAFPVMMIGLRAILKGDQVDKDSFLRAADPIIQSFLDSDDPGMG